MTHRALSGGWRERFEQLETALGSPSALDGELSFEAICRRDEQGAFPEEGLSLLRQTGFFAELIPTADRGALTDYVTLLQLARALSRRDLTLAIATGQSFLGAAPVWLAGSDAQRAAVASLLSQGRLGALALTEEETGSDLLSSRFTAFPRQGDPGALCLKGRKWLINNGARGAFFSAFARTAVGEGPRCFSVVFIKNDAGANPCLRAIPPIPTHGIRGADISGFVADGLLLPSTSIVGGFGSGLEVTLKALQITRTLCAAFSLGAADTALRATLAFAKERVLYGSSILEMGHVRRRLVDAYLDLVTSEVCALQAAHAIDTRPKELSLLSAMVKYFVPWTVERLISDLAAVLGARSYLRGHYWSGIFEKMRRDAAVVGLFDGSTHVNAGSIAGQLPGLVERRARRPDGHAFEASELASFATQQRLAQPKLGELSLVSKRDSVLEFLLNAPTEGPSPLNELRAQTVASLREFDALVVRSQLISRLPTSSQGQELARRYCFLHALACLYAEARAAASDDHERALLLRSCMARSLQRLHGECTPVEGDAACERALLERVMGQYQNSQLFSLERLRVM